MYVYIHIYIHIYIHTYIYIYIRYMHIMTRVRSSQMGVGHAPRA